MHIYKHKVCMSVVFIIRCRACVVESSYFSDEKTILFEDSLQEWSEEGRVHQAASLPVAQHSSKGEPICSMGHTEGITIANLLLY